MPVVQPVRVEPYPSVVKGKVASVVNSLDEEKGGVVGHDGRTFEFCPYNTTSKSYDQTRAPLGLNVFLGSACLGPWPLHEQKLLDIGCGTGTFLNSVKSKFGGFVGIDYSEGMIAQAKVLLGSDAELMLGSADKLPFEDASFHCATFNQVTHHFPKDDDYKFVGEALKEAFRIVKPGGFVWISTSTPEQQRDAFWWLSLFPKASAMQCDRFTPLPLLKSHLCAAGFEVTADSIVVPMERSLMAADKYLANGVNSAFDPDYRCGDSSWSMAENAGELDEGLAKLKQMIANGEADAWLQEREALRLSMGQATFVIARKPVV